MTIKIFIGNLNEKTTAEPIRKKFEQYGEVAECDVLNRYGFVHMAKKEDADKAIAAMNGSWMDGNAINVEISTSTARRGAGGGGERGRGGFRGRGGDRGGRGRGRDDRGRFDPYARPGGGGGDRYGYPADPYERYPPPPYSRERIPPPDPYARDPYYERDPYARYPPPERDPYASRYPPPYERDPYARRERDPYARPPPSSYERADPYARPPPDYYSDYPRRSPEGYPDRYYDTARRPEGYGSQSESSASKPSYGATEAPPRDPYAEPSRDPYAVRDPYAANGNDRAYAPPKERSYSSLEPAARPMASQYPSSGANGTSQYSGYGASSPNMYPPRGETTRY